VKVRVAGADDAGVQVLTGADGLQPDTVALADIDRAVVEVEFAPIPPAVVQALGLTPATDPVALDDLDDADVDDADLDDADLDDADDDDTDDDDTAVNDTAVNDTAVNDTDPDSDATGSEPPRPAEPAGRTGEPGTGGSR
jgi:hypothetical protein